MINGFYCNKCEQFCKTITIEKEQTLCVKGKTITLVAPVRVCAECGEEIYDSSLDSETLARFYNAYRESERLLLPSEIKSIRMQYNLSQASFAKLLGFGEKTITRYENGAIQDACHDILIKLLKSSDAFSLLWEERKHVLSEKEIQFVERKLKNVKRKSIKMLGNYYCGSNYATKNALGIYEGDSQWKQTVV